MVYKRYIKRGNRLLGPYYYKSVRNKKGKVMSIYLKDYKPYTKDLLFNTVFSITKLFFQKERKNKLEFTKN